jgi:hypothetical protein
MTTTIQRIGRMSVSPQDEDMEFRPSRIRVPPVTIALPHTAFPRAA